MGGGINSSVSTPFWLAELLQQFLFPEPEHPPENAPIVTSIFWRIPFKKLGLLIIWLSILIWTKLALLLTPSQLKLFIFMERKMPFLFLVDLRGKTVFACVSATTQVIPPLIIWKRKTMAPEMATGEIPGTIYGFSENGWTNSILFDSWFKKLFMRYAPASRPLILFMDGHSSHCPDTLALAAENGIILFTLPPNTTHLMQPLDKGVLAPSKNIGEEFVMTLKSATLGKSLVTIISVVSLAKLGWSP